MMAAGVVPSAPASQNDARWRRPLLTFCAFVFGLVLLSIAAVFGLGGRPWYGDWSVTATPTRQPFVLVFQQAIRGGASDRAGIRDGDTIDLREQDLEGRVATVYFDLATKPVTIFIHHRGHKLLVRIVADSIWEAQPQLKLPYQITAAITSLWFLACAALIAFWGSRSRIGRTWALILACWAVPESIIMPSPQLTLLYGWFAHVAWDGALLLLIYLTTRFGARYYWRRILEWCAYAAVLLAFPRSTLWTIGIMTLRFDPMPYQYGVFWLRELNVAAFAVAAVAIAAVASTPRSERSRAAWLLLPLPLSIAFANLIDTAGVFITSWWVQEAWTLAGSLLSLLGVAIVTYALLNRRVLDVAFVLSRTIVVAIVSLIVVAAFVLLEWLLGTVLAGVSHATGLVANAALALFIGVSLGYIHQRVDKFVDMTFFRKRYEDERALLDFSKEAACATDAEALLDAAIAEIKRHTDARDAAILLDREGSYVSARSFGDSVPPAIDEDDAAILALRTRHKPLDPQDYQTAMRGALALPMLARGRLIGVLVSGERACGEAYAPDEVEALSHFAHGVGTAVDSLITQQILDEFQRREIMR